LGYQSVNSVLLLVEGLFGQLECVEHISQLAIDVGRFRLQGLLIICKGLE
jgi:hypothetical protein